MGERLTGSNGFKGFRIRLSSLKALESQKMERQTNVFIDNLAFSIFTISSRKS